MATTRPSDADGVGSYDVFISYSRDDARWAARLATDLESHGVQPIMDEKVRPGVRWAEALDDYLAASSVLVSLWGPGAPTSQGMLSELGAFQALLRTGGRQRRIVPIILGERDLLKRAPAALTSVRAVFVGAETYAAGPEIESAEWTTAVEQIVATVREISPLEPQLAPPDSDALREFSRSARTALSYAWGMLGALEPGQGQVRAAGLIGTLLTSARGGMTPTTGDVVRLVVSRQSSRRNAERTLAAAAHAAGLEPLPPAEPAAPSDRALWDSPARELAVSAVLARRRTDANRVHLRHMLAAGVHPAVPAAVWDELCVTLPEMREEWAVSLEHTWPPEFQAGWRDVLELERERRDTPPPSARTHADKWTTEDSLDYALYAKAISKFIQHEDAEPPMVISVQAPWGQGKTSLMRMVQKDLDSGHPDFTDAAHRNGARTTVDRPTEMTYGELRKRLDGREHEPPPEPTGIRTVWFNAWKYQNSEQIWAGLAHAILTQLPARLDPKAREFFWFELQRHRIDPSAVRNDIYRAILERFLPRLAGWLLLGLGALIVAGITLLAGGLDAVGAGIAGTSVLGLLALARRAWTAATKDVLHRPLEGAYVRYVRQPDYATRVGFLHLVEEDMVRVLDLLTPDDKPVVIFIDDLDRCSPTNVSEVIAAMNLFLAGEYPNCAFVIGIDAEVVAASMEVVHADIIKRLSDRSGELGWRFMDKFVQLPFVVPSLHPQQREAYLRGLFKTPNGEEAREAVAEAEQLESDVKAKKLSVDEFARRVGELAPKLASVEPGKARELGEQVVVAGADAFSDSDPEVVQALADQMEYLSDNPRTIKRAVNLYRFHRFAAYARQASSARLKVATPEQIGRWIVVIVRWPHFVRWLQAVRDEQDGGQDPASRVLAAAASADSVATFAEALKNGGITASWTTDPELFEFLRAKTRPELSLDRAGERGLW